MRRSTRWTSGSRTPRPRRAVTFADLLAELELVEAHAAANPEHVAIARSPAELDSLTQDGRPVLIHVIEGGFQLGANEAEVRDHVRILAERGVAYVTLAHLFWRKVATSAPALPFLPDWLYHRVFPQPDEGLTVLGRTAARAMVEHGILIDITYMTERSMTNVFTLLDHEYPEMPVPLIATHMACWCGGLEYSFSDETIRRVAERGGVMGCILCKHYITNGLHRKVDDLNASIDALRRHVDRICEVTGSLDHVAIGSDLDGDIMPAQPGLEHMGRMRVLQDALRERYGPHDAEKIASGNALRVLRSAWRSGPPPGLPHVAA